jgi:hypothetical protein
MESKVENIKYNERAFIVESREFIRIPSFCIILFVVNSASISDFNYLLISEINVDRFLIFLIVSHHLYLVATAAKRCHKQKVENERCEKFA